jgi:hypothetical protein
MMTPEDIKAGLAYCKDAELCDNCPIHEKCEADIIGQAYALIIQLEKKVKDAEAAIEERDAVINLMQIQMRGDCGCCAHGKDGKAEPCTSCLASKEYHPRWEYEGLPEIPKGYVLPKKGES